MKKYCKVLDQCYIEASSQVLQTDMQFMMTAIGQKGLN